VARTLDLVSDCSRCFGLCCVLLPFSASRGFGVDKPGGVPCHHLDGADRCTIHATLREDGWPGCAAFECFGAGQRVSQETYAGVSWREDGNLAEMAAVLTVVRHLHEALLHLGEVARRSPDPRAGAIEAEVAARAGGSPEALLTLDLDDLLGRVGDVLGDVSARLRSRQAGPDLSGHDLAGADLRGRDLRGGTLRRALLIRADLRGSDLSDCDLLGADLRDADLRGASMERALFLSQAQVNTATGDAATTLAGPLTRPAHWANS
jgi:hypothetical protein